MVGRGKGKPARGGAAAGEAELAAKAPDVEAAGAAASPENAPEPSGKEHNGVGDGGGGGGPTPTPTSAPLPRAMSAGGTTVAASWWDLFRQWAPLGYTTFGGPSAHVGQYLLIFVERLHWLTAPVFTEIFALSQCIPGPSSTQMAYSIGIIKKGTAGGLLTGLLCFQMPGAVMMSLVGLGVARWLANPAPWLHGLTSGLGAAGVALIAVSAVSLSLSCCKDKWTAAACLVTGVITFYFSAIWLMPVLILAGGLLTLAAYHKKDLAVASEDKHVESYGLPRWAGAAVIALWVAVLVGCLAGRRALAPDPPLLLQWWTAFYQAGSMIFGGGQVVVPLLYNVVVQQDCVAGPPRTPGGPPPPKTCTDKATSWVTTSDFYTGLAVIQAMPGPMFNFAAYLGAVMARRAGVFPLVGILIGLVGLNAPGLLLLVGVLPWWAVFRHWAPYRRALPGLNASAVGLVVSAAVRLGLDVRAKAPWPDAATAIMMLAFGSTHVFKVTPPLVVAAGGVAGVVAWAAKMK